MSLNAEVVKGAKFLREVHLFFLLLFHLFYPLPLPHHSRPGLAGPRSSFRELLDCVFFLVLVEGDNQRPLRLVQSAPAHGKVPAGICLWSALCCNAVACDLDPSKERAAATSDSFRICSGCL